MSEINSLLPDSATPQEHALARSVARISDVPVPIRDVWNVDACPLNLLPWLAWALGVDEWSETWSEEAKRNTLRESLTVQRKKGTVWAVKRALANAGLGTVVLLEGVYGRKYDGSITYNGLDTYGDPSQWATYRCVVDKPISIAQAEQIRRILAVTAPARCKLLQFVFTQAANLYDGKITYNGTYSYGTA